MENRTTSMHAIAKPDVKAETDAVSSRSRPSIAAWARACGARRLASGRTPAIAQSQSISRLRILLLLSCLSTEDAFVRGFRSFAHPTSGLIARLTSVCALLGDLVTRRVALEASNTERKHRKHNSWLRSRRTRWRYRNRAALSWHRTHERDGSCWGAHGRVNRTGLRCIRFPPFVHGTSEVAAS